MSSTAAPRRYGSVVFADSSFDYGAVETDLVVPHYSHNNQHWSIGGNMCAPLKALVISGVRHDLSDFPKIKPYGVVVCFDTGSEGFFIIDDTGGHSPGSDKEEPSVSEIVGGQARAMGDGTGTYEIVLAGSGGDEFSVRIPEAWRDFPNQGGFQDAIRRPPFRSQPPVGPGGSPATRSQMLLVGNLWLQAVSVTFSPHEGKIFFAHLDSKGRRAPKYLGPLDAPPQQGVAQGSSASLLELPPAAGGKSSLPPFWRDSGYLGTALTQRAFEPAGLAPGQKPRKDVVVPLKFMVNPQGAKGLPAPAGDAPTVEAPDAQYVSQPCLQVSVPTPGGGTRTVTQVADTGSGVTLILGDPTLFDAKNDCDDCGCVGSANGAVEPLSALFREYSPTAGEPKQCSSPGREAGCEAGCCTQCCLGSTDADGKPLTANTPIQCAVSYCTGMVQYKPAFVNASFPGSDLSDVRIFAGRAAAVCEPAVKDGVWGCWFWANEEKTHADDDSAAVLRNSSTLPFYVLRNLGQETGKLSNMTWNFWRSDLAACKEQKGGSTTPARPSSPSPSSPPSPSPSSPPSPSRRPTKNPAVLADPFSDGDGATTASPAVSGEAEAAGTAASSTSPIAPVTTTWSVVGISAVVFAALSVVVLLFFIAGSLMARGPQRQ